MKRILLAVLLCQSAALALAQASVSSRSSSTSSSTSTSVSTSTAGGSAHANAAALNCGGVGVDDQQRMKAEAAHHDLLVTFAQSSGAYLADVDVEVRRDGNTVVRGHCGGPLMLLDLSPKGSYEIRARANGVEQRKTVTVGARPARVTFTWPAS